VSCQDLLPIETSPAVKLKVRSWHKADQSAGLPLRPFLTQSGRSQSAGKTHWASPRLTNLTRAGATKRDIGDRATFTVTSLLSAVIGGREVIQRPSSIKSPRGGYTRSYRALE